MTSFGTVQRRDSQHATDTSHTKLCNLQLNVQYQLVSISLPLFPSLQARLLTLTHDLFHAHARDAGDTLFAAYRNGTYTKVI